MRPSPGTCRQLRGLQVRGNIPKTSRPVEEPEILRVFGDNHFLLIVVAASHSTPSSDPRKTINQLTFAETEDLVVQVLGPKRKVMKN